MVRMGQEETAWPCREYQTESIDAGDHYVALTPLLNTDSSCNFDAIVHFWSNTASCQSFDMCVIFNHSVVITNLRCLAQVFRSLYTFLVRALICAKHWPLIAVFYVLHEHRLVRCVSKLRQ